MRVSIPDLTIELPEGWFDVTEDPGGPFTLAKPEGVGSVQFSVAKYKGGEHPNIDCDGLQKLLVSFGENRGLHGPNSIRSGAGENFCVAGDFVSEGEFIRIWYVSNGSDVALVSYVTLQPEADSVATELGEAESIVESLRF